MSTAGAPGGQTERLTYSREIVASEVEIVIGDQLVCRHAVGYRDGDARVILLDCVCRSRTGRWRGKRGGIERIRCWRSEAIICRATALCCIRESPSERVAEPKR